MCKKFLFLVPTLEIGGAEISTIVLINKLSKENNIINILTCKEDGVLRKTIDSKVRIIELPHKKLSRCVFSISSHIKKFKPNVIFSIIFNCNIIAMFSTFISRHQCLKIISERQSTFISLREYSFFNRQIIKIISLIAFSYSDKIIAVSNGVKNDLAQIFPLIKPKILTIYNGFNIKKINKEIIKKPENDKFNNLKKRKNTKILLACGRLADQKGFISLIKASIILKKYINFHLFIIGEGPQRNELEKFISKENLKEYISLIGKVDNPFTFMAKSDLFILSSKSEGLPGVIIQALICNTQVISTDCPHGPREILQNGLYGNLVKVNDHIQLAKGIIHQLNNPILYDKEEIKNKYDIECTIKEYKKILNTSNVRDHRNNK
tara:strand:- start:942 stop:2078 length:1137 start_codon:yes stop_codon:yes gene_type:complete